MRLALEPFLQIAGCRNNNGSAMTVDYKDTIFLPKTSFPMRAGLPKREPEILAEWEKIGLEQRIRSDRKGKEKENERKVYNAVRVILGSIEEIDIFNKKAVYLYLREITGLNTKQIVAQLSKMRTKYSDFKTRYENGD